MMMRKKRKDVNNSRMTFLSVRYTGKKAAPPVLLPISIYQALSCCPAGGCTIPASYRTCFAMVMIMLVTFGSTGIT
jgi:hypothetical protein